MRSLILGHRGLVGQALVRRLRDEIITTAENKDLRELDEVRSLMPLNGPRHVYLAAGHVGGIQTNIDLAGDMIVENCQIQTTVITTAAASESKLCFLGSSCIYPRDTAQPMPESALMTGSLEQSNSAYATAKLCGLEMCKALRKQYGLKYVALMPCNLYGPGRPSDTHVLGMLMRRFHDAKMTCVPTITVWGTGTPLREFMHVDDAAEACVHFMNHPHAEGETINVGTGEEISIHALAYMLAEVSGYTGSIQFDHSKPDGTPRKVLNSEKAIRMGWAPKVSLRDGLEKTYRAYYP